jgi:Dolichyl-phosphate-mannose-protein mannosyltransferase
MESATLTRRRGGEPRRDARSSALPRPRPAWPWMALVALALGTAVGFLVYPTFPNYDSYYSLLWGRELLDGMRPSFDAYRAPTQHPLAVFFGAALSLLGDPSDRVLVGATLISFVALAAGIYRLARQSFTPLIGLVAAVLLCTRFDFPFLAARGYIDIPYLAFVIWAAALEAERPRRGTPVFVLLALAGLMRPEAWLLSGLYFLWTFPPASWPQRIRYGVLTWIGPAVWVALDWWATGEPLFSLTHTSGLAEELGRQRTLREVPSASVEFLRDLAKPPVFYGGLLGVALAVYLVPRRTRMPLALLVAGLGTFGLVGLAGLSVIDRYLLVPSLMVMIFAAVALAGWTMLRPGRLRKGWMAAAAVLVIYGVAFTAARVNFSSFDHELTFRGASHASLERVLADPQVRRGMACGPISVPNHKLIPDVRWIAGGSVDDVLARSDPAAAGRLDRGVALMVTDRTALLRQALVEPGDDPLTSVPPPGFVRVATTKHYGAYVRC